MINGNEFAELTYKLCDFLERTGRFYYIENTVGSLLWSIPGIRNLIARDSARLINFDQCCYNTRLLGELIKKPTKVLTNMESLCQLGRKCTGGHVHAQLQGRSLVNKDGKRVPATRCAAAYLPQLGRSWANNARQGLKQEGLLQDPSKSLRA